MALPFSIPLARVPFFHVIFCAASLLGAAQVSHAEGPAAPTDVLRYPFKTGQTFEVSYSDTFQEDTTDEHAVITIGPKRDKELTMNWSVTDVKKNGDAVIKAHYSGISITVEMGGLAVKIESEKDIEESNPALAAHKDEKNINAALGKLADMRNMLMEAIVGKEFTFSVSDRGRVVSVDGLDEIMDNLRASFAKRETDMAVRAQVDAVIEQFFGEDTVRQTLSELFIPYPEAPVVKGLSWEEDVSVPWPLAGPTSSLVTQKKFTIDDASAFTSEGIATITGKVNFVMSDSKAPPTVEFHPNACTYSASVNHGMVSEIHYGSYLQADRLGADANGKPTKIGNFSLQTGYDVSYRATYEPPPEEEASAKPPRPVALPWDDIQPFAEGLAAVLRDGLWGYVDETGQIVIAPRWQSVGPFSGGLASVVEGDKWGFIDRAGKVVIAPAWDEARPFSEERAEVQRAGLVGFIDQTGKVIAEPKWTAADSFSDGMAAVWVGDKIGYLDTAGRLVIAPQWTFAKDFVEGTAEVGRLGKYGFIDHKGAIVVPIVWNGGDPVLHEIHFDEGLAPVLLDGKYTYVDRMGHAVGPGGWDQVGPFSEGLAMVWRGEKAGFIDRTGKIVLAPEWDEARGVVNGFGWVARGGLWAPFGKDGKLLGDPEWGAIQSFSEDRAAVGNDGKGWGYIDHTGSLAIDQQWNFADAFSEGRAAVGRGLVEEDATWGFVDKDGTVVVELKWDKVGKYSDGLVMVAKNTDPGELWGFVDKDGKVVSEPQWDKVRPFSKGYAVVQQGNKMGFIDKTGKVVVPAPKSAK